MEKVKMLSEPFGIPVLEVAAAYSSKFDSRNFQPGFRAYEMWQVSDYLIASFRSNIEREVVGSAKRDSLERLLRQISVVKRANASRKVAGKKPLTLMLPQRGGPIFVPILDGAPMQADINAAINLGFRSVASPTCFEIHRRIRTLKKQSKGKAPVWELRAVASQQANKREQVAFNHKPKVVFDEEGKVPSCLLLKAAAPNFFYDPDHIASFDTTSISMPTGKPLPLSSGVGIWSYVKQQEYWRCLQVNQTRIDKWLERGIISKSDINHAQHISDKELATLEDI
jgi:hypothetical protein